PPPPSTPTPPPTPPPAQATSPRPHLVDDHVRIGAQIVHARPAIVRALTHDPVRPRRRHRRAHQIAVAHRVLRHAALPAHDARVHRRPLGGGHPLGVCRP